MVARYRRHEADLRSSAHRGNDSSATSFAVSESGGECNLNNSIDSRHSAFAVSALTPYSASVALGTHGISHGVSAINNINPQYPTNTHAPHSPAHQHHQHQQRSIRQRQLIIAVTANGADCGECGENGFDQICLKPLTKTDIYRIINRYFQ